MKRVAWSEGEMENGAGCVTLHILEFCRAEEIESCCGCSSRERGKNQNYFS